MVLRYISWSPDSCPCAFDYVYDDVQLTQTFKTARNICQFHSGLADIDVYNCALGDNQRKNYVCDAGINALPSVLSATGASGGGLITGAVFHYGWTNFQSGRILFIQYQGSGVAPNAVQRVTIQSGVSAVASGRVFVTANISGVSGITIVA